MYDAFLKLVRTLSLCTGPGIVAPHRDIDQGESLAYPLRRAFPHLITILPRALHWLALSHAPTALQCKSHLYIMRPRARERLAIYKLSKLNIEIIIYFCFVFFFIKIRNYILFKFLSPTDVKECVSVSSPLSR